MPALVERAADTGHEDALSDELTHEAAASSAQGNAHAISLPRTEARERVRFATLRKRLGVRGDSNQQNQKTGANVANQTVLQ